ncbi:MAG: hypothetical protein HRT64_15255, partial [Erythrobacter sp.]|nr:hypothetical protein [Erythrobacter sp.]
NTNGDNGSIVIRTEAGDLTLTEGTAQDDLNTDAAIVAHGSGNVLLAAEGAGTDILAQTNADIETSTGHITLFATRTIDFDANVDTTTSAAGTIDIAAQTGDFDMDATATLNTVNGDIRITVGDDVLDQVIIGDIFATNADVSIETSGSVLDTADTDNEVEALTLRIVAGKGVGLLAGNSLTLPVNSFETAVDVLSIWVKGSDGVNILEDDALTIGDTAAISVETVQSDATVVNATENTQSDVVTTNTNGDNGSIVIRTEAGDLTLTEGTAQDDLNTDAAIVAHGSGNVLLAAEGAGTDILAQTNADIETSTGHITLFATRTIDFDASVDTTTTAAGTIDIAAQTGDFDMDATATLNTVDGDIRITVGDDVLDQVIIGDIFATNADVSIETPGSVLDTADADNEVEALTLRIVAGKGVGLLAGNSLTLPVNSIETAVDVLSIWVKGSDGVNILEDDALTIGDTAAITVQTVGTDAVVTENVENTQSDVVTTNTNGDNGSIVIRTEA